MAQGGARIAGRRSALLVALASLPVAAGCTKGNPAFDADGDGAGKGGATATEPDAGDGGIDDASGRSDDTRGSDAGATGFDATTGDTLPATTDSGPVDATETGAPTCSLAPAPAFGVSVTDLENNPLPLACAMGHAFSGAVIATGVSSELRLQLCADTCPCDDADQIVTFQFSELTPTPGDALDFVGGECINLGLGMPARQGGLCEPSVLWIEAFAVEADYPLYIATNGFTASSFSLPEVTLGAPIETCDDVACLAGDAPGRYQLFMGDVGPIAPGDSTQMMLNPYAGVSALYEVTARFAEIIPGSEPGECTPRVGWTAAVIDN